MYFCRPHLQSWRRLPERQRRKKQVLLSDWGAFASDSRTHRERSKEFNLLLKPPRYLSQQAKWLNNNKIFPKLATDILLTGMGVNSLKLSSGTGNISQPTYFFSLFAKNTRKGHWQR